MNTLLADVGATGDPALLKGDAAAVPVLNDLMQYPDKQVRWWAAIGLGRMGPPAKPSLPALLHALDDGSAEVRLAAAGALMSMAAAPEEVMPVARRLAQREDWASVLALSRLWLSTPEAVPFLTQALRSPIPEIRRQAAFCVESKDPFTPRVSRLRRRRESFGFTYLSKDEGEPTLPDAAKAALVVPLLRAAALDQNDEVRQAVAEAVDNIDPEAAALVQAAHNPDRGVRWESLRILLRYVEWNTAIAEAFLVLWADPDPDVREWARTHHPQDRQPRRTLAAALWRRAEVGPLRPDLGWLLRWMDGTPGDAREGRL
jgi:HEAT repeat protein